MGCHRKHFAVLLSILGVLALPGLAQDNGADPWIKNPANGHYYRLLPNAGWKQSQKWAESCGGNLVTIDDQAEQDWVFDTFAKGGDQRLLWIGLRSWKNNAAFAWVDGTELGYTNWFPGEPNNVGQDEHFVAMYYEKFNTPGSWNDWKDRLTDPIGIPFQGVVEIDQ